MSKSSSCGQLTRMWFAGDGWRKCARGRSLPRSVRGTRTEPVLAHGPCSCLEPSGDRREAYLPAQQASPCSQARFPRPYEHPWWPRRAEGPSGQGPHPPLRLIDRVRERDAFVRLRRDGVRVRADSLWCSFVPDPTLMPPQVAFAIGRRVGSAVRRNRLRRRLRALLAQADVPPGLYLIGASARDCELTFDELGRRVDRLLERVTARSPSTAVTTAAST